MVRNLKITNSTVNVQVKSQLKLAIYIGLKNATTKCIIVYFIIYVNHNTIC